MHVTFFLTTLHYIILIFDSSSTQFNIDRPRVVVEDVKVVVMTTTVVDYSQDSRRRSAAAWLKGCD